MCLFWSHTQLIPGPEELRDPNKGIKDFTQISCLHYPCATTLDFMLNFMLTNP